MSVIDPAYHWGQSETECDHSHVDFFQVWHTGGRKES